MRKERHEKTCASEGNHEGFQVSAQRRRRCHGLREGNILNHESFGIDRESVQIGSGRVHDGAGSHGGDINDAAPRFYGAKPGDGELLNALIGSSKVRVVGGGKDHIRPLPHHLPENFVIDDVKTDRDTGNRIIHAKNGVSGAKGVIPGNHRKQSGR